ncbi:MAG TPA: DUF2892 domain-containing protein [Balneolaceae bacterium]|nr:DUF2892 domain-containing protein [Balneolaceae bacterium]
MKKNVGNIDSLIRVLIGAIILIAGIYYENWVFVIGLILVFSGTMSWCPIYRIFKIDTYPPNLEREN